MSDDGKELRVEVGIAPSLSGWFVVARFNGQIVEAHGPLPKPLAVMFAIKFGAALQEEIKKLGVEVRETPRDSWELN
ncbi:MAG: hypothetical protein AAGE52_42380 [Myxococcota bacterium]